MMQKPQPFKRIITRPLLVAFFLVTFAIGCASNSQTVKTETSRYPATSDATVVEERTVTTTEEEGDVGSSGGILSGTVNLVGEIIALPFRLVGGLLRIIF
jgi:hypothetical protein